MKKVGIVSLYYYNFNYGGLLQAYALTKSIEKIGLCAEQICIKKDSRRTMPPLVKLPGKIKSFLSTRYYGQKMKKRSERFLEFMNLIPHSIECYTWETIHNACNTYDYFVCGSDQIWNPNCTRSKDSDLYMLGFVEDRKRKISYAASVGVSNLTEVQKSKLNKEVQTFNAVSLREKSAKMFFDEPLKSRIEVVLDPTLLLSSSEWEKIESAVQLPKEYIFCYFLGDGQANREKAKKISKELKLPIVISPYINLGAGMSDIGFGDVKVMNAGPQEFLYMIHHASLVLTDSFHACVFSMQFKSPFFAFSRDSKDNMVSMHSRISDFAEKFSLTNQLLLNEKESFKSEYMKVDWTPAYKVLEKEREKSMEFLRNALSEVND